MKICSPDSQIWLSRASGQSLMSSLASQVSFPLQIREMKNKFRSIEELKKELADLELNVKTDREILTQLLQKYRDPALPPDSRSNLLTDLEYYVHQVSSMCTR
jgi:Mg2+ and Co2+ transporter CorA